VTDRRALIEPPWLVKIELTKGCNLRCKFCPVSESPEFQASNVVAPAGFLDLGMAAEIGFQLSMWAPRVRLEFTMRGEPTLNQDAAAIMSTFRRHLPAAQLSMFTNGTGWLKDGGLAAELLDSGLNILNVDCYNNTYDRFSRLADTVHGLRPDIEITDFRKLNAYGKVPRGHRRKVINLVPDIADPAHLVGVRRIHNMAGNLAPVQLERYGLKPLAAPLEKKCARPFRELTLTWDGHVLICCHDWSEKDVLGHVSDGLENIWYGNHHHAILVALYEKRRTAAPCNTCDYAGGHRLGFLRDPRTGASYRDKRKPVPA
jgi:molybdenum cofactor biosynthesis enzyme MoaA